jgi:hypothetical protein
LRSGLAPARLDERAFVFRSLDLGPSPGVLWLGGHELRWHADASPADDGFDVVVVAPDALDAATLLEARSRLREGGAVVAAVENRLGVAALTGTPGPTGGSYAGVEGRASAGLTRRELEAVFAAAGFAVSVHGVFPAVSRARIVFADALLDSPARSLAWSAPRFPSAPSTVRAASELHLWRELVRAGLGAHLPNGFLAVATDDPERSPWPADQLAAYFSTGVRAEAATTSRVVRRGTGLAVQRTPLLSQPTGPVCFTPEQKGTVPFCFTAEQKGTVPFCFTVRQEGSDPLVVEQRSEAEAAWVEGVPLVDLLEVASEPETERWLRRWRAVAGEEIRAGNIDCGVHNVVVADGALRVVDREWFGRGWEPRDVLERAVLVLALVLAPRCPPGRWRGCTTVADVAHRLAALAGVPLDLDRAVTLEAAMLGELAGTPHAEREAELRATLSLPLTALPLGDRDRELRARADAAAISAQEAWRNAIARGDELDRRLRALQARAGTAG